jgi:hypothetical protein
MAIIKSQTVESATQEYNIYNVPKRAWNKWSVNGRLTFNKLYSYTNDNRGVVCGTDLFGSSAQVEKVLNATIWNMAWDAASYVTKLDNTPNDSYK